MIIRIEILIGLVKYSYQSMFMSMYMNHLLGPDTLIHHESDPPPLTAFLINSVGGYQLI